MNCTPEQVVIGAGLEALMWVLLQLFPREVFALEDPGHTALRRLLDNLGRSYVPVEMDAQGMRVEALEASGAKLAYDGAYGGKRGRSAVLLAGDRLVLYCSGDGSGDAKTPEGLRDELAEIGRQYAASKDLRALGLDSGGSSQCRFPGGSISSARRVAGYFCVWLKKKEGEPMKGKF